MNVASVRRLLKPAVIVPVLLMAMVCATMVPANAQTDDHIVSGQAMQQQIESKAATRQQNIETVQKFFKTPMAERAMKMEHVDPAQVQKAIPTLPDAQLQNLSARATTAQQQFSAGSLTTDQMLLLIIILLVVVILVAVH